MYSALIIGAGQIAGGYDNPNDEAILTHAHAYIDNPDTELLGFYDVNYSNAEKMAEKWSVKSYKNLVSVDIVSICVPDEFHTQTLLEAEKFNPKLIFLEKPVCRNLKDIEILNKIKTPVLVNYSRSFSKSFQGLSKRIQSGEFGKYQSGFGYCGKGFIHNGSHMVNLLNLLIGDVAEVEFKDEIKDFYEDDPSRLAVLKFGNGKMFIMNPVDCRHYTVFELDLIFDEARIKILNSGYKIEIHKSYESEKFKGYKMLELSEQIETDMDFALKNAVKNAVDYLRGKDNLLCTLKDGINAIAISSFCLADLIKEEP